MALSPQRIRDITFKPARKGYDQGEVDTFLEEVASTLESAQNDATAMEARARAAVARLQELTQGQGAEPTAAAAPEEARGHVDEAETISRTLLLAQRTADQTVADAQAEADRLLSAARDEAASRLDGARDEAAQLVEEGKVEARREGESERVPRRRARCRRCWPGGTSWSPTSTTSSSTSSPSGNGSPRRSRISPRWSSAFPAVWPTCAGHCCRRPQSLPTKTRPRSPDVDGDQEQSEISEITRVAEGVNETSN